MNDNFFAREEKIYSGMIKKIAVLKEVKPNNNWVVFNRSNLVLKMEMKHKKDILNNDLFALKELFSNFRIETQPKHSFRLIYAIPMGLALIFAMGGLTAWASMKSLPGSYLYGVKITVEKAYLILATGEGKNKLQSEIAGRRLQELKTVLNNPGSIGDKEEKVNEVVDRLQQQLIDDKAKLPSVADSADVGKSVSVAKEVAARAEQVKKGLAETKQSLSPGIGSSLSDKLAKVTDAADQNSLQALKTIINKPDSTEAEKNEIMDKFSNIIKEKEDAINKLVIRDEISQATSTADKFPINAVLVNQSDQAKELLDQIRKEVADNDLKAALETLKTLNEIIGGAERILTNSQLNSAVMLESKSINSENASTSQDKASSSPPGLNQ